MTDATYAGDVPPGEAWTILEKEADAVLVDVRTDAEWSYVGLPDLNPIGKTVIRIPWKVFPAMLVNPRFAEEVAQVARGTDAPLLFLCRSGQRSRDAAVAVTARGFTRCYNIADGFEGPLDADGHRGTRAGWKAAGLPWTQS